MTSPSFQPGLAVQRYRIASTAVDTSQADILVDAGCNVGNLLKTVLAARRPLSMYSPAVVLGIDLSYASLRETEGQLGPYDFPFSPFALFSTYIALLNGDLCKQLVWPSEVVDQIVCHIKHRLVSKNEQRIVLTNLGTSYSTFYCEGGREDSEHIVRMTEEQEGATPNPKSLSINLVVTNVEVVEHIHPLAVDTLLNRLLIDLPNEVAAWARRGLAELQADGTIEEDVSLDLRVSMLLTTPNGQMNCYLGRDGQQPATSGSWYTQYRELRHNDHYFELGTVSFVAMADHCLAIVTHSWPPCSQGDTNKEILLKHASVTRLTNLGHVSTVIARDPPMVVPPEVEGNALMCATNGSLFAFTLQIPSVQEPTTATSSLDSQPAPCFPFKEVFGSSATEPPPMKDAPCWKLASTEVERATGVTVQPFEANDSPCELVLFREMRLGGYDDSLTPVIVFWRMLLDTVSAEVHRLWADLQGNVSVDDDYPSYADDLWGTDSGNEDLPDVDVVAPQLYSLSEEFNSLLSSYTGTVEVFQMLAKAHTVEHFISSCCLATLWAALASLIESDGIDDEMVSATMNETAFAFEVLAKSCPTRPRLSFYSGPEPPSILREVSVADLSTYIASIDGFTANGWLSSLSVKLVTLSLDGYV